MRSDLARSGMGDAAPRRLLGEGRTIGVFDAGIGGIPITALIKDAAPGARIIYLGDTARRPYGPQPPASIRRYLGEVERFMRDAGVDLWVIACNTASVVAADALSYEVPVVDMVHAGTSCITSDMNGPVGVIGTTGTVTSGAFERALPENVVRGVAAEELLRLAEIGGGDDPEALNRLADDALRPLLETQTAWIILACTDFTCILDTMEMAANGRARLIDPAERAVALVLSTLETMPTAPSPMSSPDRLCFTAPAPIDAREYALEHFGLRLPEAELVTLT